MMKSSMAAEQPKQDETLLVLRGVQKHYPVTSGFFRNQVGTVKAVDGVDLFIQRGETLGLVGESGCGKSTLGRVILRLEEPTAGDIIYNGEDLLKAQSSKLHELREKMQIIFQDPYSSLNPRQTIGRIIAEGLNIHKIGTTAERRERVRHLMEVVGLRPEQINRYPHEFSGGQRQRIGIARALALHPEFIICDEPLSALDVSIQAQVINLLEDLQEQYHLTYLFISHDLSVVRHISDRVAVMYLGQLVELAPKEELYERPYHPYTRTLLQAVPFPDPHAVKKKKELITEAVDSPAGLDGCKFSPRCPKQTPECREKSVFREVTPNHWVRCWHHNE
jgi:oligopeptide transport system ATP-binding protein